MNRSQVSVSTPEVLWHGGGNENGKPDPVYSVDFHPMAPVMCTSGIDASVPPKGSVRIWRVVADIEGQEFLVDLCDHQSAVNVARFSPDGKMLATASERQIVVYNVTEPGDWSNVGEMGPLERIWLRPTLNEVFDMQWSPDSTHLVVGAIDCKAEIIRVSNRDSVILPGHNSYIQGVAWDPLGEHVVTQSADRSCKVHKIKAKPGSTVKVAGKGHVQMRMQQGFSVPDSEKKALTAADFGVVDPAGANGTAGSSSAPETEKNINLFADSYVPSFFRRVTWSPDGALIIAPTGIYRPPATAIVPGTKASSGQAGNSYCTHIFSRHNFASPCASLVGLEEPSVAVRCCPRPYALLSHPPSTSGSVSMIPGAYRFVFAVVTLGSVFLYDTQHAHPIAKFSGLHYAPINDAAWSPDGRVLAACSSDGYLSFFRFEEGALGKFLPEDSVPVEIKRAQPCLFHYVPPIVETVDAAGEPEQEPDAEEGAAPTPSVTEEQQATAEEVKIVSAKAEVEADFAVEAKKRKRIQPIVVGALGSLPVTTSSCAPSASTATTDAAVVSGSLSTGENLQTVTTSSAPAPSSNDAEVMPDATVLKPAKKRITPQLIVN